MCFLGVKYGEKKGEFSLEYVMVAAGGMIGALARYVLAGWVTRLNGSVFPLGTFVVNISGSLLLGLLGTLMLEKVSVDPYWRILITIGFLGSFTTFSTLQFESLQLMETGMSGAAFINLFGSIALGLAAAWFGIVIARLI